MHIFLQHHTYYQFAQFPKDPFYLLLLTLRYFQFFEPTLVLLPEAICCFFTIYIHNLHFQKACSSSS